MQGLLEFLKTPAGTGLLAGAATYAANAGRGAPVNSIGRGLLGGLAGYQGATDREADQAQLAKRNEYFDLQMAQARQGMADQQAQRDWRAGLQPAPGIEGPQQTLFEAAKVGVVPVTDYLSAIQPKKPEYKTVGSSLLEVGAGGVKPVFTEAPKPEAPPTSVREFQYAQQDPAFGGWLREQANLKAPKTNITNSINTEKPLLNEIAGGLGKSITDARSGAQAALSTIGTVNRLHEALDSGKVMAGPGATFRQYGLQVGNLLGVSGKDASEKLLNTRQAIQSLAQLELDAAQQMKGQGQITESERAIIRRAASGDIDGMTTGELRLLGGVLDRTARTKIQGYNSQVKPLMSNKNAAPLAPFLAIEEPPTRAPAASAAQQVLRFDANGNPVR